MSAMGAAGAARAAAGSRAGAGGGTPAVEAAAAASAIANRVRPTGGRLRAIMWLPRVSLAMGSHGRMLVAGHPEIGGILNRGLLNRGHPSRRWRTIAGGR